MEENHPAQSVYIKTRPGEGKKKATQFWWTIEGRITEDRTADISVSKTVPLCAVPPWTLEEASSDLGLMENYEGKSVIEVFIVEVFI